MIQFLLIILMASGESSFAQSTPSSLNDFDETPIRTLAAQIKEQIQAQIQAEIAQAQSVANAAADADVISGRVSAIQAEVEAAGAESRLEIRRDTTACESINIAEALTTQLRVRCKIAEIQAICEDTKTRMSNLLVNATSKLSIANPQRARSNPSVIAQLVTVQNNLLTALDASDTPVVACYNGLESLAGSYCLNTYRDVLTENLNFTVKSCLPETVDQQITDFVTTVRELGYSGILSEAANNYSQARESQIKVARILLELTQTGQALLAQMNGAQGADRAAASAPASAPGAN